MFSSCTLLTSDNMISLSLVISLTVSCNFVVFEKFTRAYLHQIALEIMLLPVPIAFGMSQT